VITYRNILALAASLVLVAGCDYFKPADPQIPSGPTLVGDYSDPELTLQSIVQAVQAKGQSGAASVYSTAFADSTLHRDIPNFHQYFWSQDIARWVASGRPVPSDWNFRSESQFYDKGTFSLIQLKPGSYQLTWEPEPNNPDRIGSPTTLLHRHYNLFSLGTDQTVTDIVARGYADLTFQKASDGLWYITRWDDREDPVPYNETLTNVTWGQRRLEYGQ